MGPQFLVPAPQSGRSSQLEGLRTTIKWRPGKGYDLATSPDGRWLAVTMGRAVKLFSLPALRSPACSTSMAAAEVRHTRTHAAGRTEPLSLP